MKGECWVVLWQNDVDHAKAIAEHHVEFLGARPSEIEAKRVLDEHDPECVNLKTTGGSMQRIWSGHDHYWLMRVW